MPIEKPIKAHFDVDTRISTLYFKDYNSDSEYMMRGGICWPMSVETPKGLDVYGYVVMAGYSLDTKLITVFEQKEFVVIDNILNSDKTIEYEGLSSWFNSTWAKYFGIDYYYHQDFELSKRFRLEVIRSEAIIPKPQFVEVPWDDESRHVLWKYVKLGQIRINQDSKLFSQLETLKNDNKLYPAVHALQCCLVGFERFPYRER